MCGSNKSSALESLLLAEICNYPPRQNHQRDNHGNQKQPVGGFPNQDFADGHCGVLSTSLPVGSPLLGFLEFKVLL
jgi:hypothetical protein